MNQPFAGQVGTTIGEATNDPEVAKNILRGLQAAYPGQLFTISSSPNEVDDKRIVVSWIPPYQITQMFASAFAEAVVNVDNWTQK